MRLIYLCLSPTFGMHQYTADLANRMADAGHNVHVIAAANPPRDRYAPHVNLQTPINNRTTGLSTEGLDLPSLRRVLATLDHLIADDLLSTSDPRCPSSVLIHLTAPHLWNPYILRHARRRGIATLHSLHDLDPHQGTRFGVLIRAWNRMIIRYADHILVHGQCYRDRLIASGLSPNRITLTPLLHLFLSYKAEAMIEASSASPVAISPVRPFALFFGRILPYKGIGHLLTAVQHLPLSRSTPLSVALAGPGDLSAVWNDTLPSGVELHNHLISDTEAINLFRDCALLVLPYIDATQSALIAAAFYFRKPVIITRTGALPEYVRTGETGWVIEPGDVNALASALAKAISEPKRLVEMGHAGRAWYDEQRQIEQATLLELYRKLTEVQI